MLSREMEAEREGARRIWPTISVTDGDRKSQSLEQVCQRVSVGSKDTAEINGESVCVRGQGEQWREV